jgi:hypothetical protein
LNAAAYTITIYMTTSLSVTTNLNILSADLVSRFNAPSTATGPPPGALESQALPTTSARNLQPLLEEAGL